LVFFQGSRRFPDCRLIRGRIRHAKHGLAREAVPSAPSSTIKRLRSIFEKEKARLTTAFVCHATGLACQIENKNNLDAIPTNRFIGMQWGVCCSKQGNAANLFVLS
jgi:hypothetical protein